MMKMHWALWDAMNFSILRLHHWVIYAKRARRKVQIFERVSVL